MNELQIFSNPAFGEIRVTDQNGEPWFVAADVCRALDIGNPTQAIARLDSDESTLISNEGREMNIISEPGLYASVSYTHLDVYKRQSVKCVVFR